MSTGIELTDQTTVAITGATSGIGEALSYELARYGVRLALCGRRKERLADVARHARNLGSHQVHETVADVSIEEEATRFIATALEAFDGDLDVLVLNAGRGHCASVEDTPTEHIRSMFELNVFQMWYLTRPVLPLMKARQRGHIIAVSSIAGKIAFPYNAAYVAAKHAVVGFIAALRTELVGTGVEATVICPAAVQTAWASVTEGRSIGELFAEGIARSRIIAQERGIPRAPLQRFMSANEIAQYIIRVIEHPPGCDVLTHPGSEQLVETAHRNRADYEQMMLPLLIGMRDAYQVRH